MMMMMIVIIIIEIDVMQQVVFHFASSSSSSSPLRLHQSIIVIDDCRLYGVICIYRISKKKRSNVR